MKIGIVGIGVVGKANVAGFEELEHTVYQHDIKFNTTINDVSQSDIVFICVPTPQAQDGSCDTSIIHSVIDQLVQINYQGIVAIRSTVVPGFTQQLIDTYKDLTICFVPEFLRERCAEEDFIENNKLLVVGTHDTRVYNKIVEAHGSLPENIQQLTPTESEILKYYNNVYAALRVVFANTMFELCNKLDCNYTAIKDAYIKTGKAIDLYLDVNSDLRGYGGMCLPKDTQALAVLLKTLDLDFDLITSIHNDNNKIKQTVFNGMRNNK